MRFKGVTWRNWSVVLSGMAVYGVLGYWLAMNGTAEEWIYRIGLTVAAAVPLAFVGIYTYFGLTAEAPGAKWWKSELGSAFVLAALSLIPITWPLAWVFWFQGGVLTSSWLAWLEVSGPAVTSLAWGRVCWLWIRVRRADAIAAGAGRHGKRINRSEPDAGKRS